MITWSLDFNIHFKVFQFYRIDLLQKTHLPLFANTKIHTVEVSRRSPVLPDVAVRPSALYRELLATQPYVLYHELLATQLSVLYHELLATQPGWKPLRPNTEAKSIHPMHTKCLWLSMVWCLLPVMPGYSSAPTDC